MSISNSGAPASSGEPSMEEILASIRRILKEDEATAPGAAPAGPESPGTAPLAPEGVGPEGDGDDVFQLDSSMIAPEPVPAQDRAPPPVGTAAPPPAALPPAAPFEPHHIEPHHIESHHIESGGALSMPNVDAETATVSFEDAPLPAEPLAQMMPVSAPAPSIAPAPAPAPAPTIAPAIAATQHGKVAQTQPAPHDNAMTNELDSPSGLLDEAARKAAASSIGTLIRSVSAERAVAVRAGGPTIEDIVRDELRSLLKSWLDSNLPSLVERVVRAEIQRLTGRDEG